MHTLKAYTTVVPHAGRHPPDSPIAALLQGYYPVTWLKEVTCRKDSTGKLSALPINAD